MNVVSEVDALRHEGKTLLQACNDLRISTSKYYNHKAKERKAARAQSNGAAPLQATYEPEKPTSDFEALLTAVSACHETAAAVALELIDTNPRLAKLVLSSAL